MKPLMWKGSNCVTLCDTDSILFLNDIYKFDVELKC